MNFSKTQFKNLIKECIRECLKEVKTPPEYTNWGIFFNQIKRNEIVPEEAFFEGSELVITFSGWRDARIICRIKNREIDEAFLQVRMHHSKPWNYGPGYEYPDKRVVLKKWAEKALDYLRFDL